MNVSKIKLRDIAFIVLLLLCVGGFLTVPHLILQAPPEREMGIVQYIFYFHVGAAWVALLSALVSGVASVFYLSRRSRAAEEWADVAAALAVVFGLCVLISGPIWARKAWTVWWNWDGRLTSTLILWLVFVMYGLTKKYAGREGRQLAAALAVFGMVLTPLVYMSVQFWRTMHPTPTVVMTLDPAMRPAFWSTVALFCLFYALLFIVSLQVKQIKDKLKKINMLHESKESV